MLRGGSRFNLILLLYMGKKTCAKFKFKISHVYWKQSVFYKLDKIYKFYLHKRIIPPFKEIIKCGRKSKDSLK